MSLGKEYRKLDDLIRHHAGLAESNAQVTGATGLSLYTAEKTVGLTAQAHLARVGPRTGAAKSFIGRIAASHDRRFVDPPRERRHPGSAGDSSIGDGPIRIITTATIISVIMGERPTVEIRQVRIK